MKKLLVLIVFVFSVNGSAQSGPAVQEEASGLVWTKTGALVISNVSGKLYNIEITGKKFDVYDGPEFNVDGRGLKLQTVNKNELLGSRVNQRVDDRTVLRLYHDQYGSTLFIRMKFRPMADPEFLKLNDGNEALWWSYFDPTVAKDDMDFTVKEFCLSAVKGNWIFLLKSSLTHADTDTDEAIRQFLVKTLNTLKLRDKPLSLEDAAKLVKQGKM
jgi:hypothetical protein